MKKRYQIEAQQAVKGLDKIAEDPSRTVQLELPMAEMVRWLRQSVDELVRQAGVQLVGLLMEAEVKALVATDRWQTDGARHCDRWPTSAQARTPRSSSTRAPPNPPADYAPTRTKSESAAHWSSPRRSARSSTPAKPPRSSLAPQTARATDQGTIGRPRRSPPNAPPHLTKPSAPASCKASPAPDSARYTARNSPNPPTLQPLRDIRGNSGQAPASWVSRQVQDKSTR